jgi:hypothetical protein
MKKILVSISVLFILFSCSREKAAYIDLRTGRAVKLERDSTTGAYIDQNTGQPVYMYVDTKRGDTICGKTGEVVNGHVRFENDTYYYDEDKPATVNNNVGDAYRGQDVKIKTGDHKIKIDGKTGERKEKRD